MFDVAKIRDQFPALNHSRRGKKPIFLDGAAGTQVPQRCILAMVRYLSTCNANTHGAFATSQESDHILERAHTWTAAFLNAHSPEEVVFGPNMTTLTFQLSRSLAKIWKPGDEILLTRLDHDANVTPWKLAARDAGATVRFVDIHPEDCSLDMESFREQLNDKTKLVALTAASNLVGTRTNLPEIIPLARKVGALVFVDAVHFAPHGVMDVQKWNCDFLACSPYKFFGPHLGILWGKREHLTALQPYKLRPASDQIPDCWMTGTQNHEALAGLTGTFDYLSDLGKHELSITPPTEKTILARLQLQAAMQVIEKYEQDLFAGFVRGLREISGLKIWGVSNPEEQSRRVPTVAVTHKEKTPLELAKHLAAEEMYAWNGNMYALELSQRLNLESTGGVLRMGLAHYNTSDEIEAVLNVLKKL